MSKKLIYLVSFVLVLGLAAYVSAAEADIEIPSVGYPKPILDGVMDNVWLLSTEQVITIFIEAEPTSPEDCSGSWWALWDEEYLYVLVNVIDEALVQDSEPSQGWLDDRAEIYVDGDNAKGASTDNNDYQYNFRWNHGQVETPVEWYNSPRSLQGVEYGVATTDSGYIIEARLPWSTMTGEAPYEDQLIGINVMIDDDDDGGGRDTQLQWFKETTTPHVPSEWGTAVLVPGTGEPWLYVAMPNPADGVMLVDTWVNLSWSPGARAASHDVYIGDNFDDVNDGAESAFQGNQAATNLVVGFPGFAFPDGLVPGTTYYWRVDEVNDLDPNSPWVGPVWSFSIMPFTASNPDPADGAEFVDLDATFSWTGGYGAKLHTVFIGTSFDEVNDAVTGVPQGTATFSPDPLEAEKVYYWRVDESDPPTTHKGEIWSFTTPGAVGDPQPANGAADVQMTATLSWTAADNAASHELYFGTDKDAVKNATTASPEHIGPKALGAESYDPGGLAWDSSYAWRVDEVYPTETVRGLVWTFETADFILVDDFESYNDVDPPDPASNRIFDKWIDGFGTTTNGALVGNDMPPYAEQNIVHGGVQSMIYRYNNEGKTSEATLTLVWPKDWTQEGVTKLSLWHRGTSVNAPDKIYVALNGTAVVHHDDPAATNLTGWKQWVIDLAAFGVNLTNVNSITIGVGTQNAPAPGGGTGTLYFDDIRLIR